MAGIESTIAERRKRYGEFMDQAFIAQGIKSVMRNSSNWAELDDDMQEALEFIATKIGRILNGDASYKDSWHDIIGYAKLVEDRLVVLPANNPIIGQRIFPVEVIDDE